MDDQFGQYRVAVKFAVPILLFLLFFSPDILDPTRIGWLLHGDWGQHFLGWHALRQAPYGWPYNHHDLLAHPTGLTVLYTDSNPLFALPLKLISPFLPADFQYIGLWFLLCVCLQYITAYLLVKPHAPGQWSAIAGAALLSLLPTFYNRIGHDTLVAHWLILWALAVFFNVKNEPRKTVAYSLVMFVTGLVHPYLLVMVMFIWGADQLRVMIPLLKARRFVGLYVAAGMTSAPLISAIIALFLGGAFGGSSAASDGFGVYAMALDAPFNPVRKDFALALLRGPQDERVAFEGFQYLGAGLLGLIGFAIWLKVKRTPAAEAQDSQPDRDDVLSLAKPLLWPMVVLTVLAVSNEIHLYSLRLIKIPLPYEVMETLNIVRASGRLLWPVAYTAVFLSLCVLYRQRGRALAWALPAMLVIQLIDILPFASSIRAMTVQPNPPETLSIAKDPKWRDLIKGAELVSFQPPLALAHQKEFYEITYQAVSARVPVNTMYAARENAVQVALENKERQAFNRGQLNPRHLYVLLNRCQAPAGTEARLRELDGLWVIPPAGMETLLTKVPPPTVYKVGETYSFDYASQATCQLDARWFSPDLAGVWMNGTSAGLSLPVTTDTSRDLKLTLNLGGHNNGRTLRVLVNGTPVSDLKVDKKPKDHSLIIPAALLKPSSIDIGFAIDAAMSDADMARRHETRRLGLRLYSLRLD